MENNETHNQQTPSILTSTPTQEPKVAKLPLYKSKLFLGLTLGLIVLAISTTIIFLSQQQKTDTNAAKPVSRSPKPLFLALLTPTDGQVATNGEIVISGKTLPKSTVLFFTETHDSSTEADARGDFSGTIQLGNGINTLTVTAFSENGEEKSVALDIVYDETAYE